jgi:hypothetical protein
MKLSDMLRFALELEELRVAGVGGDRLSRKW